MHCDVTGFLHGFIGSSSFCSSALRIINKQSWSAGTLRIGRRPANGKGWRRSDILPGPRSAALLLLAEVQLSNVATKTPFYAALIFSRYWPQHTLRTPGMASTSGSSLFRNLAR